MDAPGKLPDTVAAASNGTPQMPLRTAAVLACLAVLASVPAHAQTAANDAEKAMTGTWELSNAERDKLCTAVFSTDRASGGFKIELDAKCADAFPPLKEVTAWKYPDNDLLRLVDGKGKSLAEFSEVETGIFEAPTPGIGVLFLQAPGDAGPPPKPPEDVAGDWTLMRGGKALCTLTLATTAAENGFTVSAKPGCDAAVTRLGFNQWRIDRDEMMIAPARGNPWRFESVDPTTWQRVPENPNPYTLVKQ
jgi:hypothetical protein